LILEMQVDSNGCLEGWIPECYFGIGTETVDFKGQRQIGDPLGGLTPTASPRMIYFGTQP